MKVSGKVVSVEVKDGGMFAVIQFNGKLPKPGDLVSVKWGRHRTDSQNALYWVWLTWIFNNGAKDEGYESVEELHEAFKGRFLVKSVVGPNGMKSYQIRSTTELNAHEFSEYFDKCQKAAHEFLGIDDSPWQREYANEYASFNSR